MSEAGCATENPAENVGCSVSTQLHAGQCQIFSSGAIGLALDHRNYLFTDPHELIGSQAASASSLQSVD